VGKLCGDSETIIVRSNHLYRIPLGLESEYDLLQGSLTHQSDVGPLYQPASSESQPLVWVEQELVDLQNENAALRKKNTDLETENNALRYLYQ
jgi:hypothetical protein